MKPTNTNIAEYYGLTRQTIGAYKKERPNMYNALKEYFVKLNPVEKGNAEDVGECVVKERFGNSIVNTYFMSELEASDYYLKMKLGGYTAVCFKNAR